MRYIGLIEQEGDTFGIYFPDVLGCVSSGKSMEEATSAGIEALQEHCDILLEDGATLPRARTLEELKQDPETKKDLEQDLAVFISVIPKFGNKKQIGLQIDEGLIKIIDETVERHKKFKSRTAFIEYSIKQMLAAV